MEVHTEIRLQEKEHSRKTSLAKSIAFVQSELNKHSEKLAKHQKLQIIYTIILFIAIGFIWVSLAGPLSIAILTQPSLSNLTRPNVDTLKTALADNPEFLPTKCQQNDTNNITSNYSINCPTDYVSNCTMCVPICGLWHPFGESYFIGYRVETSIVGLINFLFSLSGLIILIKVPGTFRFPQINYLFMFINAVIFSSILTAAALPGPYYFFCSERKEDYFVVSANPAIHITILGVITHISYFSFNLWFVCATINVFLIIYFPSWQISSSRNKQIIIFVIESIVSFGVPILFPLIYLSIFENYSFLRLPQTSYIIEPIPGLIFIVLPLLLFTAVSLTIISLTLYKIQTQKSVVLAGLQKIKLKSFEIRLIIFAISLGVVVFIVFLGVSIDVYNSDILQFYLEEFWSCLTLKNNFDLFKISNLTCPTDYKAYFSPFFQFASEICFGAWSILLLIILTTKETRDAWHSLFKKLCRTPVSNVVRMSRRGTSGTVTEVVNVSVNNNI